MAARDAAQAGKAQESGLVLRPRTVFRALVAARMLAALLSNISDCDETFNYWEPAHYLLRGSGLQTWEYSPAYAIRSYAYVGLHALVAWPVVQLTGNKVLAFFIVRSALALVCAWAETRLYAAVSRSAFGPMVGKACFAALLGSTGMFISSAAFLPSSFAMTAMTFALGFWLQKRYASAIAAVAVSALLGWPFTAALGIPLAIDVLALQRRWRTFVGTSCASLLLILGPIVLIDSAYYGKLVVAPLNIVLYNVLSSNTSSELYGTEPWHFYFLNGLLNFNLIFVLALLAIPLMALWPAGMSRSSLLYLSPLAIWLVIFVPQPHKEER